MKSQIILAISTAVLLFASCGGNGKGVKYNPAMSNSEQEGKSGLNESSAAVSPDSMANFDGIKFSVLPPTPDSDIPEKVAEQLTNKIISIAGSNGVGGLCVNPILGIALQMDCVERSVTGTAPQKAIVKYEITLYCGNFISNEIYSSVSLPVTGVGGSFESAAFNAVSQVRENQQIKDMFRISSQKALDWYNTVGNIDKFVDNALSRQDYALAMAILESVPVNASPEIYENAMRRNREVCDLFFQTQATQLYDSMLVAISASNGSYNPEAGAYFCLIPPNAEIYPEALKAFEEYAANITSERMDNIRRMQEVEDREAAYEQQLALATLDNERYRDAMEFEIQKIKIPYEASATIEQIKADGKVAEAKAANTGGFLGLGHLWEGGFNLINRVFDKLENLN